MLLNHYISTAVRAISIKFVMVMQFDPIDRFERQKFQILKIQDGGGRHLKNIEKSPYLGRNSSDFDEIWHTGALRPS